MTKIIFVSLLFFISISNVQADVKFTKISSPSLSQLNGILRAERNSFAPKPPDGYVMPAYSLAKNEIDLYKVTYDSIIPEQGDKPIKAYGLLALPKDRSSSSMPIISYQHGTVFGKHEVPSYAFSDQINPLSYETRLMVAQFASQGYIVIAADYFGMGDSNEPEAYTVKASEQQACLDLYKAVTAFLDNEQITYSDLFLTGWSQGGVVTTAFLEKLESLNIPVKAASTAAAPSDLFAAINGWIYNPRKIDAPWLNTLIALTVFSYENYFSKPGLARDVIKADYYENMRKIYERDYNTQEEFFAILNSLPANNLKKLLNDEYSDPSYFADSEYGKILSEMQVYRRIFKTPVKMFYGTEDEVVSIPIGKLASTYQKSMGSNGVVSEVVHKGNHHRTFLTAVKRQKLWFDKIKSH